jgi:N-acetylneuraminic acid mutarotase
LVLVSCGSDPSSAELYHPDTNEWILTGSPSLPRSNPTATLLRDGNVLVVGRISSGSDSGELRTEIYDHSTQTWSFTGGHPLSFKRIHHATTELADGRVLVVGGAFNAGNLAEIYDPATQAWTLAGPLNQGRADHTATLLSDDDYDFF